MCTPRCDRRQVDDGLYREKSAPPDPSQSTGMKQERYAYFGDLHVHTAYSFDGYSFGTLASPYDAYRFAQGEDIKNPAGYNMQLSQPMEFYAVTDHGMFLGLVQAAADTSTTFSKNSYTERYHDLNAPENLAYYHNYYYYSPPPPSFLPPRLPILTDGHVQAKLLLANLTLELKASTLKSAISIALLE